MFIRCAQSIAFALYFILIVKCPAICEKFNFIIRTLETQQFASQIVQHIKVVGFWLNLGFSVWTGVETVWMTGLYFNSEAYVFLVQILVKYVQTVNTLNFGLYATKDLFWSFFFSRT